MFIYILVTTARAFDWRILALQYDCALREGNYMQAWKKILGKGGLRGARMRGMGMPPTHPR
jgi:hypothetical protein